MVRVIFFCMALVALSLAAMPLMNIYKNISAERVTIDEQYAALETVNTAPEGEPSAEDLNRIESAAGDAFEDVPETGGALSGGFSDQAPAGL